MSDRVPHVDDEHMLALGGAVYALQRLELLLMAVYTLVLDQADIAEFEHSTLGRKLSLFTQLLEEDAAAGGLFRDEVVRWVHSLEAVNTLRNDIFHSLPFLGFQVRTRPSGLEVRGHGSTSPCSSPLRRSYGGRLETV